MATAHQNLSEYDAQSLPSAKGLKIGLVVSEWNDQITSQLYTGAKKTLQDCQVETADIETIYVPGSFELVYGAKYLIERQKFDAVIAIGSVIQGATRHFEFVCQAVSQGIKDLNVQTNTPVIFCVLTDDTLEQAQERSGGKHGNKGVEAAIAAIKMATLGKV
ncbi:MAG: 6,7-dimethyl-8-ribityllumazine synthase [Flavobacteriaceae bacterium]